MVLEEILDVERFKKYLDLIIKRNAEKQNLIGWVLANVVKLRDIYKKTGNQTREAVYFMERVTGHTIPGFEETLEEGLEYKIAELKQQKNHFGKNFAADWSSPSTNLLYGYWTDATPDGRGAREDLSFGLDPSSEMATNGLLTRILSQSKLD